MEIIEIRNTVEKQSEASFLNNKISRNPELATLIFEQMERGKAQRMSIHITNKGQNIPTPDKWPVYFGIDILKFTDFCIYKETIQSLLTENNIDYYFFDYLEEDEEITYLNIELDKYDDFISITLNIIDPQEIIYSITYHIDTETIDKTFLLQKLKTVIKTFIMDVVDS